MKKRYSSFIALFLILASNNLLADIEAITLEGKNVLLKNDNTWEYIEAEETNARYAHLSVTNVRGDKNYCLLGLTLHNDLADYITSIVFKFSAYNHDDVRYDTVTKGFQHIKPTNENFREITFSGISCEDIQYVRVHGADRCETGELTKFSSEKGACLELVQVGTSDKIVIFKRYSDTPEADEPTEEDSATDFMDDDDTMDIELEDMDEMEDMDDQEL